MMAGDSRVSARSAWMRAFDDGEARWGWRAAWVLGMATIVGLTVVLSGGQPVPLALIGLLFLVWSLHDPMVPMPVFVLAQIIWLIGGYAPGGVSALAPSKLTLGLSLVSWALWAWRGRIALTFAPHQWGIAAFFVLVLLGPVLTPAFDDAVVGIGKYGLMLLPYLLVANTAVNRRGVTTIVAAITVTACVAALLALVERFMPGIDLEFDGVALGAHTDDQSLNGVVIKRVSGGLGDANWFSYTMATTLPLCLYWFRGYRNAWVKVAAVGAALLQLAGIVLSYTRTPMIGLAGALLLLLWQRRIALLPVAIAGMLALVTAPAWLPDGFVDRFFSKEYATEGSTPVRKEIFDMAIDLIHQRPLLGFGYQQFGPQFIEQSRSEMGWEWDRRDQTGEEPAYLLRAHNLYLDIWVQHGIVGLAALLAAFWLLLREMWVVSRMADVREADLALCLLASLLSFYLCGLGGHAQELKVFWITAGLAAGLRRWVLSGYYDPDKPSGTALAERRKNA
jgi:hypothetical protein